MIMRVFVPLTFVLARTKMVSNKAKKVLNICVTPFAVIPLVYFGVEWLAGKTLRFVDKIDPYLFPDEEKKDETKRLQ